MPILFSVVLPVLNQARFLERALLSVIPQLAEDCELIVIDGGSTDGSLGVLKRYQQHFSWWCSEKDQGQSDALNKGFAHATGEFLTWLNADDVMLPGVLESVRARIIEKPESSWIVGNLVYIDGEDRIMKCARDGRWHDVLFKYAPVRVYGPSSFFSRSLLGCVGGFNVSFHYMMDTELWMRFKEVGARFDRIQRYFWGFRVHNASKTSGDLQGQTPPEMEKELDALVAKFSLKLNVGCALQRLWRCLNGCYWVSWRDTRKYKGLKIDALK